MESTGPLKYMANSDGVMVVAPKFFSLGNYSVRAAVVVGIPMIGDAVTRSCPIEGRFANLLFVRKIPGFYDADVRNVEPFRELGKDLVGRD